MEKGSHTTVSTLSYVVKDSFSYNASYTCHVNTLIEVASQVKLELSMVSPEFANSKFTG